MTKQQKQFLQLAIVEQKHYDEIVEIMGIPRRDFSGWWDELKTEREQLAAIRRIWKAKFTEISFADFRKWYEATPHKCHYCGVTEQQTAELWKADPKLTKRNRGRCLEIDHKEPNANCNKLNNLVFACYWCNNAKTDTFTEVEFMKVGEVIAEIWQSRLSTD